MAVTQTFNKVTANGDGVQTAFVFTFKIFATTDIQVIITDANGVEETLTLTTHYSVTATNNDFTNGGTVTVTDTAKIPASGEKITIVRVLPLSQTFDYEEGDSFPAKDHQDNLDRAIMIAQQLDEKRSRAVIAPIADPDQDLVLPTSTARANEFLAFDAAGRPIAAAGGLSPVTPYIETVLDDPDASTARDTLIAARALIPTVSGSVAAQKAVAMMPDGAIRQNTPSFEQFAVHNETVAADHSHDACPLNGTTTFAWCVEEGVNVELYVMTVNTNGTISKSAAGRVKTGGGADTISMINVDATRVAILVADAGAANLYLAEESAGTFTAGSPTAFPGSSNWSTAWTTGQNGKMLALMSSTQIMVISPTALNTLSAALATISTGTTITGFSSAVALDTDAENSSQIEVPCIRKLDATHWASIYHRNTGADTRLIVGTTTPSVGSSILLKAGAEENPDIAVFSDTSMLALYGQFCAFVTTDGSTTATKGTEANILTAQDGNGSWSNVVLGEFVYACAVPGAVAGNRNILKIDVSGASPALAETIIVAAAVDYEKPFIVRVGNSRYVHGWENGTADQVMFTTDLPPKILGIAEEAATDAAARIAGAGEVSVGHSGLTPGLAVYTDSAGGISHNADGLRVGIALSATEILVDV